MIFLYIISLLCVLAQFVPNMYLPEIVKWPVCLVIILFITFLFNLPKKDTRYITNDSKRKIINFGLFNPLILYVSVSLFILGFVLIADYLIANGINDLVGQYNEIFAIFEVSLMNNVLHGLILILTAIIIYFLRYSFKNNASNTGIKLRAFWYINLTLIALLIGLFKFIQFSDINLCDYLLVGYNGYIFLGIIALVLLIDFIGLLIRCGKRKKALKKASTKEVKEEPKKEVSQVEIKQESVLVEETPSFNEETISVEGDPLGAVGVSDPWSVENAKVAESALGLNVSQTEKVKKIRAKEEKKLVKEEKKIKREQDKILAKAKKKEMKKAKKMAKNNKVEESPVENETLVVEEKPVVEDALVKTEVVEETMVVEKELEVVNIENDLADPLGEVSKEDPWATSKAVIVVPKQKKNKKESAKKQTTEIPEVAAPEVNSAEAIETTLVAEVKSFLVDPLGVVEQDDPWATNKAVMVAPKQKKNKKK